MASVAPARGPGSVCSRDRARIAAGRQFEPRLTCGYVRVRALRGAITCDENTKQEIEEKTQRLVKELLARNELEHDDLVSLVFTATEDLTAEFPAAAARGVGLGDIPLLCARELDIDGGKPMCIRLLVHCYTERPRDQLHHVYLDGARTLRDDLPE
jgi:chorismate mutase